MQREQWETMMPDVPENVHAAVQKALDMLETEKKGMKTVKKGNRRKMAAMIILAATMIGTTAMAAGLTWHRKTAEEFHNPSGEIQQKTLEEGVAALPAASVADNGVTVTAVQLLQDENRVYLMLKVESEEAAIDGNTLFDTMMLSDGSNQEIFGNVSAYFLEDVNGTLSKEGYYVIDGLKNMDAGWNGEALKLILSDLSYYTYGKAEEGVDMANQTPHCIKGNWELEVSLKDVTSLSKTIPVDKKLEVRGVEVTVNYVRISPLSVVISYSQSDIDKIDMVEDDMLWELFDISMKNKQGALVQDGYGAISGVITQEGERLTQIGLLNVLDVEEIGQIVWGDDVLVMDVP